MALKRSRSLDFPALFVYIPAMENANTVRPVDIVRRELQLRVKKNPSFSARSLARMCEISSGMLSDILNDKRHVTDKLAEKLMSGLDFNEEQRREFLSAVRHERLRRCLQTDTSSDMLTDSECVRSWHITAVMHLIETENFLNDVDWIANRLGIEQQQVREALEILKKSGCIQGSAGRYRLTGQHWETEDHTPNASLRSAHLDELELAKNSLESVPLELRDVSSISMAIDVKQLPAAKEIIKDFQLRLAQLLEDGHKTEVYTFNTQLIPLTKLSATRKVKA